MKQFLLSATVLLLALTAAAQRPAIPRDAALEARIESMLSKMSLDEKIGQMLELNLDKLGTMSRDAQGRPCWLINETQIDTLMSRYHVGSLLNAPGTRAATVKNWQRWIRLIQAKSMKHIGIPDIFGLDNNHGVTYVQGGTLFPQPINVAASFNTALARADGEVTAYESRAANCPWVYNPTVDLGRDPRWSRLWESYGEDATVNARMVVAKIAGLQGPDANHISPWHVATSVKHYMGYGAPFTGKDRTPAYIAPNMLREKYFEPFRAAAHAGALTFMVNSASINGVPVHASYEYLTQWLKHDLDWDGMLVTDWADINNLYQRERVATDKKDAIRIAVNAGIDMSMDPYSVDFCILLRELVDEGKVTTERIDDAVRRILRVKFRLGLFEQPNTGGKGYEKFGSTEFATRALQAAEESEVLLKNAGNVLPIKRGTRILVTGPNANQMRCLNGGWSYSWQGSNVEELAERYNTIYEALRDKYGAENVTLAQGVTYNEHGKYWEENAPDYDAAVRAADGCDVIVACVGENSYCETPGNLTDLTLSSQQRELVKRLAATGKPVVLVLNEGRPRLVADIEPLAKAVVHIMLPGNYGGDALANLLAGDANFSARLPYTYPREINSLANYDYKVSEEVATMAGAYDYDAKVSLQWPFGYGLSYTHYEYSGLSVSPTTFTPTDTLSVSVNVRNAGSVAGKEAVLLYTSDHVATIVPDNKRLRDFKKISLKPGEAQTVAFRLPAADLAFVGADGRWRLEKGTFTVKIGALKHDVECAETKVWDTPNK